jgi:uncharacterized protein YceK
MHPYRVKEYMWVVIVLMVTVITFLSGCSSSPKVAANKPQYCYTSQTIKTQNGDTVNSETTLECTDDQIKRLAVKRMGMSPNCGEFTYRMMIGGNYVQQKGVSCQKLDGSWEIVNTAM